MNNPNTPQKTCMSIPRCTAHTCCQQQRRNFSEKGRPGRCPRTQSGLRGLVTSASAHQQGQSQHGQPKHRTPVCLRSNASQVQHCQADHIHSWGHNAKMPRCVAEHGQKGQSDTILLPANHTWASSRRVLAGTGQGQYKGMPRQWTANRARMLEPTSVCRHTAWPELSSAR